MPDRRRWSLLVRPAVVVVGWLVLLVAVDFGLGQAWEAVSGAGPEPPQPRALGDTAADPDDDPRADGEAMAGQAWADAYFDELHSLRYDYVPFLYPRAETTSGRYINTRNGVRASYEPAPVDDVEPPTVWFFGGSTTWGVGQRDEFTIPSALARAAASEGLPIRPVNFGELGYMSWQEAQVFERALTHRRAPALAVFYDGINELGTQREDISVDPTHFDHARIEAALTGRALEPGDGPAVATGDRGPLERAWDSYVDVSVVRRAALRLETVFGVDPVGAQEEGEALTPEEQAAAVENAVNVYRRSQSVIRALADHARVEPVFFWQPAVDATDERTPYFAVTEGVADVTIDLTAVLDDPPRPVYIDRGHTNELGARLVAEAMWESLRPSVEAWYAARR